MPQLPREESIAEVSGLILTCVTFCCWIFGFQKPVMPILPLLPILGVCETFECTRITFDKGSYWMTVFNSFLHKDFFVCFAKSLG